MGQGLPQSQLQSLMVVGGDVVHSCQTSPVEPGEKLRPAYLALLTGHPDAENLPVSCLRYTDGKLDDLLDDLAVFPHPDHQAVSLEKGIGRPFKWPFVPLAHPSVQKAAQPADGALGDIQAAELFHNPPHLPGEVHRL